MFLLLGETLPFQGNITLLPFFKSKEFLRERASVLSQKKENGRVLSACSDLLLNRAASARAVDACFGNANRRWAPSTTRSRGGPPNTGSPVEQLDTFFSYLYDKPACPERSGQVAEPQQC